MEEVRGFTCSMIGLSGTTSPRVMKHDDGTFEARIGIAILGATNMSDEEMAEADNNPFHERWYDNYAGGKGDTFEEAIENMKKEMKEIHESLWV